jgi:O-antigen/teichoic acid export membrane protein
METEKDQENLVIDEPKEPDLEKIHDEEERLKAFQASGHLSKKATGSMFGAVSMYGVAVDFGLAIFIPLLVAVYFGKWIAEKTGMAWLIPVCILLALTISAVSIYRQIINLKKKIKP